MPSISSLLRSAQAAQKKVQAQKDAERAYQFSTSLKTYDDYKSYADYIQKRGSSGVDASTALSLQKTLDSAFKGYVSNEIQRSAIGVLEGTSSSIDKYNKIYGFMQQAQNAGQFDLAQGLTLQLDNLYNSIQQEAITAQNSARTLAEAQQKYQDKAALAKGASFSDMAQSLKNGLEDLTTAFNRGGQLAYNKAAKTFVDGHRDALKAMGVDIPKDYSTNIGQLVNGVIKGIGTFYTLASEATAMTDPGRSQDYMAKAKDIASGATTFKTPAGQLDYYSAQDMASNPNLYVESMDNNGNTILKKSTIAKYNVDEQGNIMAQPTGYTSAGTPKDQKAVQKQLEKLGFGSVRYDATTGTYTAQLTDSTNSWFDSASIGKTKNAEVQLTKTDQGFQFYDKGNKKLYNIATDQKGLAGVYRVDNLNQQVHLGGQYGFNQSANSLIKRADFLQTQKQLETFNKAMQGAQMAQNNPGTASRLAASTGAAAKTYLDSIGVKNTYGTPDKSGLNAPASQQAYMNALALQPYYQAKGTIGGKAYNWAGNFIPTYSQRNGGGFNFVDANGKPISAMTYAQQTHSDFKQLLSYMAGKGDSYAGQFINNPNAAPSSLTWR